ncbi:MAG TPA: glycosyl transferase group 1 [Bacteroidales bacterium]|nr:glycosyl transferase group 1 [Bacteroidales bacterium]
MARIILFATTDLVSDQRVHRSSITLTQEGHDVLAIGRRLPDTPKNVERKYKVKLLRMVFRKGFLFYFFFNIRIFFYLLFHRFDLVCSNDLDTLLGCRLGCFFKGKSLVYDSHEYFTETPELIGRPITRNIWKFIELLCLKRVKYAYTVSQGIADEYFKKYGIRMEVIRNLPLRNENYGHKSVRPTIIYQGALNKGRGLELAIEMINNLPCYCLMIVGAGDLELKLRKRVIELDLIDRVEFRGRIPYEKLHALSSKAWLGLSLEEDLGLSYRYALPNKLFDYIQAQIAVLVSDLPEMAKIVEKYDIGIVAKTKDPKELADLVASFFENKDKREKTIDNLIAANNELVWENEQPKFIELFNKALAG